MDYKLVVTPKIYFRSINILFLALVVGQTVFGLLLLALSFTKGRVAVVTPQQHSTFLWVASALALAAVCFSWMLFNSKLKSLRDKLDLGEKLRGYQTAMIIRFALMEGPSLLSLVFFYLTGDYIFLGIAAFIILIFLLNQPSKARIIQHLQLHDDERMVLEDPGAVLYEQTTSNIN